MTTIIRWIPRAFGIVVSGFASNPASDFASDFAKATSDKKASIDKVSPDGQNDRSIVAATS